MYFQSQDPHLEPKFETVSQLISTCDPWQHKNNDLTIAVTVAAAMYTALIKNLPIPVRRCHLHNGLLYCVMSRSLGTPFPPMAVSWARLVQPYPQRANEGRKVTEKKIILWLA